MKIKPVAIWDGEAFYPEARFQWQCQQDYAVGEKYQFEALPMRSIRSHNHFFISIEDAWLNIRDDYPKKFPSPEHLRKWALVECGYCTERVTVYDTAKDARQAAKEIREENPHDVMQVKGNILYKWRPLSQKVLQMDAVKFQKSKTDVLDLLASMIGVRQKQLGKGG